MKITYFNHGTKEKELRQYSTVSVDIYVQPKDMYYLTDLIAFSNADVPSGDYAVLTMGDGREFYVLEAQYDILVADVFTPAP